MADYLEQARNDLLRRYGQIGSRLDRLYYIVFDTTFWAALETQGDEQVSAYLRKSQRARNAFVHGTPEAIDDKPIRQTVELFPASQKA